MKTNLLLFSILFITSISFGQEQKLTNAQIREDFKYFWTSIDEDYCFFSKKQTDWARVKEIYTPIIDTVSTREQFVSVLEQLYYEIYDHHANLNTNNLTSQRLVPSGADIWAEYVKGIPVVIEVRKGYGADKVGITAGMEVIAINDIPVQKAIVPFMGKSLKGMDNESKCYALRTALAGNHIQPRKLTIKSNGQLKDYFPDANGMLLEHIHYASRTESKIIKNTGYIKINDCLYDNGLIKDFDSVMQTMLQTQSLIIDLRETPSGGNTAVARAILGWFASKEQFYQKHELYAEEKATGIKRSWVEIVSPRKGKYYGKPLVILCNHWTGSVSEGITIGFDGMQRATTIGTELARLCGATYSYEMPNSKIHFSFPVEQLYHVNGSPREVYEPKIVVSPRQKPEASDRDAALERALTELSKK